MGNKQTNNKTNKQVQNIDKPKEIKPRYTGKDEAIIFMLSQNKEISEQEARNILKYSRLSLLKDNIDHEYVDNYQKANLDEVFSDDLLI